MGRNEQRNHGNAALHQAQRERKILRNENTTLEQRLRQKTRAITHLENDILTLKKESAKQIQTIRLEAAESDQFKDQLLIVGTKAVQEVRVKIEALQAEKEKIATLLQTREKNLVELQDAWFSGAPEQTRAAIEAFSERSLDLVRSLQADVAREQAANQKMMSTKQAGTEVLRRENAELRAKSERDSGMLQDLRRAREEDKRTVRMVETGKRAADLRAQEAKEIAEQQELVINQLLRENKRYLKEFPSMGRC